MLMIGVYSVYVLVVEGVGVWVLNTVGWAWDITNFVFWIGIGHAGTLISAVLYLTRQGWRTSINRAAEAMTIFAVSAAGLFLILHTGRPWLAWWLIDTLMTWACGPQFRSPLMWDVFAISTYATTSILFWFMGLVPDLATFRDRATTRPKQIIFGILALGWRGSARQWHRYERAYLILAAISTVVVGILGALGGFVRLRHLATAGWHTTIFLRTLLLAQFSRVSPWCSR